MITVSNLLCLLALLLALLQAFRDYFHISVRVHFGWLGFAVWILSLLVR